MLLAKQERAVLWKNDDGTVDALTTNGVLLCNPEGSYSGGELEAGVWREVSVFGSIFSIRGPRSSQMKGRKVRYTTKMKCIPSLNNLEKKELILKFYFNFRLRELPIFFVMDH